MRLRQRDQNPVYQTDHPDRHLQRLPPVLHGHAKVCGYRRTRGQVPAADGQDPGCPGSRGCPQTKRKRSSSFSLNRPQKVHLLRAVCFCQHTMDLRPYIEKFSRRLAEVEAALSDPKTFENKQRFQELSREYSRLKDLVQTGMTYLKTVDELQANRTLAETEGPDSELGELAREELRRLETDEKRLAFDVQRGVVPPAPTDSRNTIIEIRAGAGGSESALFAADLYRMYTRYAEARGWKIEDLDSSPSDLGGFKEVIFSVRGTDVYRRLKFESGVHRVQRVPATEAQGRVHTSTATVAVLPEAEEVDVEIK